MEEGTPNLQIQPEKRAFAHVKEDVSLNGTTSHHLVVLSTMVNKCVQPSLEGGKGPTMSTWTWSNLLRGTGIGVTGALAWV
jgi:hypothetical protein